MAFWDTIANPASMLESFLHPEKAYERAGREGQRGYNEAQGYLNPYYQHGLDAYGGLSEAMKNLMDPAKLQSEWTKGYETSPYAQQLLGLNKQQGLEDAGSMGLMGSSAALGNIQQGAGNIVSKDRQQYLDDLMKKYMTGIGIGSDLYQTGYGAGGQMSTNAMQNAVNQAGLKYREQSAPGGLLASILPMLMGGMGGGGGGNFNPGQRTPNWNSY